MQLGWPTVDVDLVGVHELAQLGQPHRGIDFLHPTSSASETERQALWFGDSSWASIRNTGQQ